MWQRSQFDNSSIRTLVVDPFLPNNIYMTYSKTYYIIVITDAQFLGVI
jgi:hypothetical protein